MDRLRSPGGCRWDADQTHESLVPYLVEETFETVEAIETRDPALLREELGDLLLQVVFHARIAQESKDAGRADGFDIGDVADGIADKLIRRHPHVFGEAEHPPDDELDALWLQVKAEEKGRTSVTDGVPLGLPSLSAAAKLRHRAAKGGVAEPAAEPRTLAAAVDALAATGDTQQGLGELLLALVAVADDRGWDAEGAARASVRDYRDRLVAWESAADGH